MASPPEPGLLPGDSLHSLPRRVFLASSRRPRADEHGFVLSLPEAEALTASDLLRCSAALVVAPPWTGKTFVSDQLDNALNLDGKLRKKVSFERPAASLKPPWWDSWRSRGEAWWIVDAIDEDERRGDCRIDEILDLLEELTKEERSRLHVLFFCRESEVPAKFLSRAERLFGSWSVARPPGLRRLRLAGLDRGSARDLVGEDALERICGLIEANGLQEIAALPAVLESLKKYEPGRSLDRREVWRGVLLSLLREPRSSGRISTSPIEVEDLFAVSQRLAALLTFSDRQEGWGTDFETLVHPDEKEFRVLREAARQAVRTAVFEPSGAGFRFAQDHVRQWFAAFALEDLSLAGARPLLTAEDGSPNPAHAGIMDLLTKIAKDPALRRWIDEVHGGIVPPSGAVPWTLAEARNALDRLQERARTAPWGLALGNEKRLAQLATPGLGAEIARRLEEPLVATEYELLLDAALAVGAPEVVPTAVRILLNRALEPRLRTRAADLVAELGSGEELQSLDVWTRSEDEDPGADSARSILAAALYLTSLWSFETAARFALSRQRQPGNDWLQRLLAKDLNLDFARQLVEVHFPGRTDLLEEHLMRRALVTVLEHGEAGNAALRMLWSIVVHDEDIDNMDAREILVALGRSPDSRRRVFLHGLVQDPDRRRIEAWRWTSMLKGEDAEWLLEVIRERGGSPDWLRETLFFLSQYQGVNRSLRLRIRRSLKGWDSARVLELDRLQKSWRETERRRRRREAGRAEIQDLAPLVRFTLSDPDLDLRTRMLRLSWSCFVKPSFRPTNVRGLWDELEESLRGEVVEVCHRALVECEPTPIPEGASFPTRILWEAACFEKLLVEDPGLVLTSGLIRKWLPAVLHTWETDWKMVLQRCLDVDRELSENLIVEAVLRDLRKEPEGTSYTAQEVLPVTGSERLITRLLEEAVLVPAFSQKGRIDLLARISRISPHRTAEIARLWADDPEAGSELQEAGIDILLASSPEEGWKRLAGRMEEEGARPVLLRMRSLLPHHAGPKADFETWSSGLLERLAVCLHENLPAAERTPGQAHDLGGDRDLGSVRDFIPALLLRRNLEGDAGALERLAQRYPAVRRWLDQTRAQEGAEGVLVTLDSARPVPPGTIPAEKVVLLLQDARYRLLRTADDLQAVVLEELRAIALDAKQHLALLYRPQDKDGKRRRLPEDALQAYLYCRLTDRLSRGTLEPRPVITLNREPLATRNMRNDIKIEARSLDNRPLTLIVEVKWSDNQDVWTSLAEQLGRRYLKESNLTHGIYFVGLCGPSGSGLDDWRARLEEQARGFQQEEPGLRISPFLLDLRWEIDGVP
ncbi:MAG: hypothetical protein ABUT39_13315 [Acidobacteriota bacterium]